jgi:hypothetical protein
MLSLTDDIGSDMRKGFSALGEYRELHIDQLT